MKSSNPTRAPYKHAAAPQRDKEVSCEGLEKPDMYTHASIRNVDNPNPNPKVKPQPMVEFRKEKGNVNVKRDLARPGNEPEQLNRQRKVRVRMRQLMERLVVGHGKCLKGRMRCVLKESVLVDRSSNPGTQSPHHQNRYPRLPEYALSVARVTIRRVALSFVMDARTRAILKDKQDSILQRINSRNIDATLPSFAEMVVAIVEASPSLRDHPFFHLLISKHRTGRRSLFSTTGGVSRTSGRFRGVDSLGTSPRAGAANPNRPKQQSDSCITAIVSMAIVAIPALAFAYRGGLNSRMIYRTFIPGRRSLKHSRSTISYRPTCTPFADSHEHSTAPSNLNSVEWGAFVHLLDLLLLEINGRGPDLSHLTWIQSTCI